MTLYQMILLMEQKNLSVPEYCACIKGLRGVAVGLPARVTERQVEKVVADINTEYGMYFRVFKLSLAEEDACDDYFDMYDGLMKSEFLLILKSTHQNKKIQQACKAIFLDNKKQKQASHDAKLGRVNISRIVKSLSDAIEMYLSLRVDWIDSDPNNIAEKQTYIEKCLQSKLKVAESFTDILNKSILENTEKTKSQIIDYYSTGNKAILLGMFESLTRGDKAGLVNEITRKRDLDVN